MVKSIYGITVCARMRVLVLLTRLRKCSDTTLEERIQDSLQMKKEGPSDSVGAFLKKFAAEGLSITRLLTHAGTNKSA